MPSIQAGQMIGPYRVLHQVGQGGMATVYKAYQAAMDRHVALKILPQQLAESPEFTGRFRQEARVIARLEHAHILPVYDYGESDGYSYLVMRYLESGTLKERLGNGPLPLAEADRIFTQLADALEYAHAQGVIHRDLKPSNVLLDERANIYLTDFGIAKLLASDAKYTGTGAMIGTPAYMSPEQAHGATVDQRSDLYSLGIILYEMVTGRVPFDADTPLAIILKQLNDPLPLPSSLRPDLPPAIEAVLLKALAKEPADRFPNVSTFLTAWKAALPRAAQTVSRDLEPPAAPPGSRVSSPPLPPSPPPGSRVSPPPLPPQPAPAAARRRNPLLGPLGIFLGLALLVCVGGVCAAFAFNSIVNRPRPTATGPAGATAIPGTPGAAGTGAAGTAVPGAAGWQSWTPGNIIYTVEFDGNTLITAGAGGITRWKANGEIDARLTTADGLPGSYVIALLIEPNDHSLWAATDNGLLHINGSTKKVYNNQNGLDGNTVTSLALSKDGLLAGTSNSGLAGGGLLLFSNDQWQAVRHFPSVTDSPQAGQISTVINTVLVDDAGNWWVGSNQGLARFDGTNWKVFTSDDGLPDSDITELAEVAGQVWVGMNTATAIFDGTKFTQVSDVTFGPVYSILGAKNGDVWVTGGGGAARRSAGRTDWKLFDAQQLPSSTLFGVREAPDGSVYIGSLAGLVHINGNDLSVLHVPNTPTEVGYRGIGQEFKGENLIFVRDTAGGLDTFDVAKQQWQAGPDLPCSDCVPLAQDDQGRLWAGGSNGLWIISGQAQQQLTNADGLPSNAVRAVAFVGSTAWIGTDAGAAVYDGKTFTAIHNAASDGLTSDGVTALLADAAGGMWVGTDSGLDYFGPDQKWQHFATGNPFTYAAQVTDLAQDRDGAVWATTNGDGLYRYQSGDWQRFTVSSTGGVAPVDNLNSVSVAPDGSLWFGAYFNGAIHYAGGKWQAFNVEDGLIYSNVTDIFVRANGEVWLATSGGVSRYQP